jgi:hypothetical protein
VQNFRGGSGQAPVCVTLKPRPTPSHTVPPLFACRPPSAREHSTTHNRKPAQRRQRAKMSEPELAQTIPDVCFNFRLLPHTLHSFDHSLTLQTPEDDFAQTREADNLFESEIQPSQPPAPPPLAPREPRAFRRGGGAPGGSVRQNPISLCNKASLTPFPSAAPAVQTPWQRGR